MRIEHILATWRLTVLLVYEEGPSGIFHIARAISRRYNGPLDCFWCASVWAAGLIALLAGGRRGWLVRLLGLSAGAIVVDAAMTKANSS